MLYIVPVTPSSTPGKNTPGIWEFIINNFGPELVGAGAVCMIYLIVLYAGKGS